MLSAGPLAGDDGLLFYNSFGKWPQRRQRREIADIIAHLTSPGRIPPDGVVIGWPGKRPQARKRGSDIQLRGAHGAVVRAGVHRFCCASAPAARRR